LATTGVLITLLYRFDAGVNTQASERVMANGQCFLCRRSVLNQVGVTVLGVLCDDVTLARNVAALGSRCGFLDGARC